MQRFIPTALTVGLASLLVGTLVAASQRASLDQKLPSVVCNFEPLHEGPLFDTSGEEAVQVGAPKLHRAAPDVPAVAALLGVTPDDVRKLLASWAPGQILPPAFDFASVNLRTWTAWGSIRAEACGRGARSGRARSPSTAP